METPILEVKDLNVYITAKKDSYKVVDNVNFSLNPGETLGIVGESGCGKSMTSLAIMGLIPKQVGEISRESAIMLEGVNLLELSEKSMCKIRGGRIALIPQDSMASLNPVSRIGVQMVEMLQAHQKISKAEAKAQAIEMLRRVGIPAPENRFREYPHQMSGGMKQRVNIGMALLCRPQIIIADEPTTALDVTVQAQILELMKDVKQQFGTSIIFISHDLGVMAEMADRLIVMYAGKIVETCSREQMFTRPLHPYTEGLLNSVPKSEAPRKNLTAIPGNVAAPDEQIPGCRFHPRCPYASEICRKVEPPLCGVNGQTVRCWIYQKRETEGEQV